MTFGGSASGKHVPGALLDHRPGCEQHRRVEIALQRSARRYPWDRLVQGYPPVHAHDIGSRIAEQSEQLAGTDAEMNPGDPGGFKRSKDPGAEWQHAATIVLGTD